MGILNVTPDSFSDGGAWTKLKDAVAHARRMHEDGAAIVDIGGESTRPGAQTVTEEEEIARVVDVIDGCADASVHCISIDTRKARVMEAALRAGARMINDVSALTFDPDALSVAAATDVPIVLMHAQGTPETMQDDPHYNDVVFDIYDYLSERVESCVAAGVARERLIVDPGIGFGKTIDHNLALLNSLSLFHGLGLPVLVGASRKRYIEAVDRATPPGQRLGGSLAAVAAACAHGIDIVRVHDVAETRQFIALSKATASAGDTPNSQ